MNNLKKILAGLVVLAMIIVIPLWGFFFADNAYVELDQKIEATYFDQYDDKDLLVFFGYVGCIHICTPRLLELAEIYKVLQQKQLDVGVLFINLSPINNTNAPELFAKSFHPQFKGVYFTQKQLVPITEEFKVYSAPALTADNQLEHSAFLYRLQKIENNYYLTRIYTQVPFSENVIVNDIKPLAKVKSQEIK